MAKVIVAVDHKYSDNNGAYTVATTFDTVSKEIGKIGGIYDTSADNAVVTATTAQIKEAAEVYAASCIDLHSDSRFNHGAPMFTGCIVTLKRSRKAPNNTPVKVVEFIEGGYNAQFNRNEPARVVVEHEGQEYTVSYNCVNTVVRGRSPWWAGNTGTDENQADNADSNPVESNNTNASEIEDTTMITNKEYWNEVNATAETIVETAFDNLQYDGIESPTSEQVHDGIFDTVLHETIDSHQWVIYTAYHLPVLQHTDNAEYMVDNFGGESVEYAVKESGVTGLHQALAYWALYADVSDKIDSDYIIEVLGDKIEE